MTNKQIIVMILAFTLVAVFCATGVFADSLTPLPVVSDNQYNSLVSQGVQLNSGSWYSLYAGSISSNTSLLYVGAVPNSDISGYYNYYAASLSSGQSVRFNNSASSTTATTLRGNDVNPDVFYALMTTNPNLPTSDCPIFSTLSDFLDFVENPTTGEVLDFSIPAGYALVIDGACEIIERDYYINNSWNFVGEGTGNRTNGSSERIISRSQIVDGFSPDKNLSRSQLIQWEALNPNLFGTASNYEFSGRDLITVSAGAAFVVSYPLYDGVIPLNGTVRQFENSVNFVGSLYLNYTTRPTIRYVALKSNTQLDNNSVGFYNTFVPTTFDEPASEVVGTDSTVISAPTDAPSGGGNAGEPPLDEEQSIFGFLGRFINRVTNLFNQASEAIHSISGACQSFFAALLGMFSWLPPEWTAVLWGFFLILACVGVVKLFL